MSHRKLISSLFKRKKDALQALIGRRTRAASDVADLVQETYLRMLRTDDSAVEDPERYLFAIAGNLIKEHGVRLQKREEREVLTDPRVLPDSGATVDYMGELAREETNARLGTVIRQLPERYQLVLALTYEEGLSQSQIAERLKISRSMVQKILIKAHAHCRSRLLHGADV